MRNADGPMSTPRRAPPRSRGTPMMWTGFILILYDTDMPSPDGETIVVKSPMWF